MSSLNYFDYLWEDKGEFISIKKTLKRMGKGILLHAIIT